MPDQGPTTVGSIVAKLHMDRDQWVKDLERTKAESREIGALRPSIRVDVDTAGAMAQIEALRIAAESVGAVSVTSTGPSGPSAGTAARVDAVAAAERRLAAAESASESATARALVAEMKLEESRSKRGRTAAQVAAAELAASEAIKRSEEAATRAAFAEEALAAAQQKAARTALEKAAAEELDAKSTVKANEANTTSASRMGLIVTAVAVLLPMMVPLAAGAVGVAGALTMMGISGILAIVGIRDEMARGTNTGAQYSVGLGSLRDNMNTLGQTSALRMLTSFNSIVTMSNDAMPMLNRQVGDFSTLLGRSGANLFSGALNSARVLEPLLITVGVYLTDLTRKFDAWTNNGGLQKFANYAMATLPSVEKFLGALGNAVMQLLAALAPLGQVGLTVFTGLFNVISVLPVSVLTDLIAAVIWGAGAFKLWGSIAPMLANVATQLGAVGAATTIATGPIGWVAATVAALAAVFIFSISAIKRATAATADYTAAVQSDSGAIGENVRQKTAQALLDSGALAAAQKLGVSTQLVTDATLGNAAAQSELNAKIKEVITSNDAHGNSLLHGTEKQKEQLAAVALLGGSYSSLSGDLKTSISDYTLLQDALGGTTISTEAQLEATKRQADAAGVSVSAYLAAQASQKGTADQTQKTTALMYLQSNAAGLLKQSLDLLNGKTLNAAQAQNQFDSQLANMSTHMDATGKVINRADTLLTGMTASAVANRGELISLTTAAENNAQAFRDAGGGAEETRQKLIAMKQNIIDNAVAHGEDRAQVQLYVDTLFKIPASIPPTKIEVDTAAAMAALDAFKAKYKSLGDTINLTATGGAGLGSGLMKAPGHADGGTVAGPGTSTSDSILTRLSVGEEVIRTASASQARPFLKAFNANPQKALASVAAPGPSKTINNHWNIATSDVSGLITEVQRRQQGGAA